MKDEVAPFLRFRNRAHLHGNNDAIFRTRLAPAIFEIQQDSRRNSDQLKFHQFFCIGILITYLPGYLPPS